MPILLLFKRELSGVGYCENKTLLLHHTSYVCKKNDYDWTYSSQCVQNTGSDFEVREGVIWERGEPFLGGVRKKEREALCL